MKHSLLSLLALFLGCGVVTYAQLPSKCSVYKPQELLSEVLKESVATKLVQSGTYGQNAKPSKMMYWDVFSDRDDNVTYAEANSSKPFGKLAFNDKVRIAKISGEYAMVYSEPNETVNYPEISGSAVYKGWIPMKNLLLWSSCLANDRGIYFKALLCVNADQRDAKAFGVGYRSPDDKSKTVRLSTDMQFYYVMKRGTGGMVLLATQHKIDGLKGLISNKLLKAWVPSESYVPWNQRSCIEPTWEHEDVEYFASRGISSKIYDSKDLTGDVASTVPFRKSAAPYDQYQYRMAPEALRFPILDGTTSDEYECSSFTSSGETNVSAKQQEAVKIEQKKKVELEKLLHFNLAIVIDGTSSMDPYFPAVAKAIKDGCAFFDKNKFKINVGVLIYRDYADGAQGLTEVYNFTNPTDPGLFEFLSSGGSYGIKSSPKDKSFTEALYNGINEALDKFPFDKDQSNLMLVVGDCGNDLGDTQGPSADQIVGKLVSKNVNLFGFQVRNLNQEAWNLYNRQLLQIMKKSLQKKYEVFQQNDDLLKKSEVRLSDGIRAKTTADGQRFSNVNIKESDQKYFGEHKYATAGTEISAQVLADLMKESIGGYAKGVQSQLDLLVNTDLNDLSDDVVENDFEGSDEVLKAATVNVNKAWLRKRLGSAMPKGTSQLITFRGWTAKKDDSGRDFYKPVLFISSEEFDELMMRLKPVDDVARQSTSDNRQPYVNALKALLKSMIPGITNEEMERKGIADVMNMIAGLNESSEALSGRTLLEISDEAAVKPTEYRRMVMDFDRKYKNLDFIKNNPYKYVREFNGVKYYWIPIENLP